MLELLKQFLGIPLNDTTNDDALLRSLAVSTSIIESYCDRVVEKQEKSEDFQSHFGRVTLKHMPVDTSAPVTVTLDGVVQSDYEIFEGSGELAHLTRQECQRDVPLDWRNYEQVVVTYTAGYDPLPSDLAQAVVYVAADLYNSEGTGAPPGGSSGAVKSMSIHDVGSMSFDVGSSSSSGSISSFGVINETAAHLLQPYRRKSA